MTPEYPQEVIAPTGLTERKWRLVRQQCRVEACETGVNVLTLYARENVLTPREKASLTNPDLDAKRKNWRVIKRLEAENARLREALFNSNHFLEHLCEALNIDPAETFIRLKNADTHELLNEKSIAAVFEQTRAALAEQEKA